MGTLVASMGSVGSPGGADHLLRIAVVRGHKENVPVGLASLVDGADGLVYVVC